MTRALEITNPRVLLGENASLTVAVATDLAELDGAVWTMSDLRASQLCVQLPNSLSYAS